MNHVDLANLDVLWMLQKLTDIYTIKSIYIVDAVSARIMVMTASCAIILDLIAVRCIC